MDRRKSQPGRAVRSIFRGGIALAILAVLALAALSASEDSFLYMPARPGEAWDPTGRGLAVEDVALEAADGVGLHAWFVPASEARATLLFCHGAGGNLRDQIGRLIRLRDRRFAVLALDYRGYGRSAGTPSEAGLYLDGEAAFDHLAGRPDVDPGRIILYGESLGGGVVAELALRRRPAGVVLQSTFTSIPDMAERRFPIPGIRRLVRNRYETADKLPRIEAPVLVVHGSADETIPYEMSRRLYDSAREPKRFHEVAGAGHSDVFEVGGDVYLDELAAFADALVAAR